MSADADREPGVYSASGELVHRHQGGEYRLADVVACFELGRVEMATEQTKLVLDAREVRQLKVLADAYSFDYEEGFIEMCLDIHRYTEMFPNPLYCFTAND
jgi:hypothetical protein